MTDYKNHLTIFNEKIHNKKLKEEIKNENFIKEKEFDNKYINGNDEESLSKNNNKNGSLKQSLNKKNNISQMNKKTNNKKQNNSSYLDDGDLIELISNGKVINGPKSKETNNFIIKLKKTAKEVEKYKPNNIDNSCGICGIKMMYQNETLKFKNSKDFLTYLEYLFIDKYDLINYNEENINKNKKEVFAYKKNYKFSSKKWKFYSHKYLCKSCLLKQINQPKCLSYFKSIFYDIKKKKVKDNFTFLTNKEKIKEKEDIKCNINNNSDEKFSNTISIDEESDNKDIVININKAEQLNDSFQKFQNKKEINSENTNSKVNNINKSNISNSPTENLENLHLNNDYSNNQFSNNFPNHYDFNLNSPVKNNYYQEQNIIIIYLQNLYYFTVNSLFDNFYDFIIYLHYINKINKSKRQKDKLINTLYLSIMLHFKDKIVEEIKRLGQIQKLILQIYNKLLISFNHFTNVFILKFQNIYNEFEENYKLFENKVKKFIENINYYYNFLID